MKRITRPPTPAVLVPKWKEWTRAYAENDDRSFYWPTVDGETLNRILKPDLLAMTQNHCAFCDGTPFGHMSTFTIEHFKPKQHFRKLAYHWYNLFPCCTVCQAGTNVAWRTTFDDRVLKPDSLTYDFAKYFIADFTTGRIEINPNLSAPDLARADVTIRAYDLNNHDRCNLRRSILKQYKDGLTDNPPKVLNDFSFRFFIEAGL